jgi:hypothetical protein
LPVDFFLELPNRRHLLLRPEGRGVQQLHELALLGLA